MRYAIISDVHANLQAWNAVLLDIRSSGVDQILCLGDLVGYGPNPAEVLESLYTNVDHFILGNHDAVVAGKMDAGLFNDKARRLIDWTRGRLGDEAVRFLDRLPLSISGGTFRCAHGDFTEPAAFNYVLEPADAAACWGAVAERVLFVGHTHDTAVYAEEAGTAAERPPQSMLLAAPRRYLVKIGSVGQPRDGDARASYCIYDPATAALEWRRIPFDIDAYRAAMVAAGLDPSTSYFLTHDPRREAPPLRELLNFSPARTPEQTVQGAVEVQDLTRLKRSLAAWKGLVVVLLLAILAGAAAGTALWHRHRHRGLVLVHPDTQPSDATQAVLDNNLLRLPSGAAPNGLPIPGWTVQLGDKRRQTVAAAPRDGACMFTLTSTTPRDVLRLSSGPVRIDPGMKLCLAGQVLKSPDFDGDIAFVLSIRKLRPDGSTEDIEEYVVKEPNLPRAGGWLAARQTTDGLPANTVSAQFHVRARFTGTVQLRDLSLARTR